MFYLFLTLWIIGDSQSGAIYHQFKQHYQHTKNYSIVSSRIEQWDKKYIFQIPFEENDIVFIFLGSNHYDDKFIPTMNNIKKIISKKHLKCYFIGPPVIRNKRWNKEQFLKERIEGVCDYISSQDIMITSKDKIHPNQIDSKKWFDEINKHVINGK
jgi:hypothetical protein